MTKAIRASLAAFLLLTGTPALAVADMPTQLNQRQATALYQQLRFLLLIENHGYCPAGQVPRSGLVSGGENPESGSQTTVITFNKGAKVKLVRQWSSFPGKASSNVQISCS